MPKAIPVHSATIRWKRYEKPGEERWRKKKERQGAQHSFYRGVIWGRARKAHLRKQPLCVRCGTWRDLTVDHINGDWRETRSDNLQTLCRSCHGKKTAEDVRAGIANGVKRPRTIDG